ncbi:MAG TPA: L-threonylcarbamoyladenylate synthase [Pirellulales bacterium]|jgi:L-threonylcarbamoyladenylate synthase
MFNPRQTVVRKVSLEHPEAEPIRAAAEVLRRGGLVAFPTETVYGLGANALDATAVAGIFAAKGRPANNPIIVHVPDVDTARTLVSDWPEKAEQLAAKFWPGSLSLVLPKRADIPDIVTAGGPTVGIRVPNHPVALALLKSAQLPIAAPSANRSNQVSPTTAEHVLSGLAGRIDLLLDAGATLGGLESTVLDLTTDPPRLLRPGLVTVDQLQAVIGTIEVAEHRSQIDRVRAGKDQNVPTAETLRSPGMLARHYAPRAKLICIRADDDPDFAAIGSGRESIGWLRLGGERQSADKVLPWLSVNVQSKVIEMPAEAAQYSARLYAALHELDQAGVALIVVDLPPNGEEWRAVHDRLRRASQAE